MTLTLTTVGVNLHYCVRLVCLNSQLQSSTKGTFCWTMWLCGCDGGALLSYLRLIRVIPFFHQIRSFVCWTQCGARFGKVFRNLRQSSSSWWQKNELTDDLGRPFIFIRHGAIWHKRWIFFGAATVGSDVSEVVSSETGTIIPLLMSVLLVQNGSITGSFCSNPSFPCVNSRRRRKVRWWMPPLVTGGDVDPFLFGRMGGGISTKATAAGTTLSFFNRVPSGGEGDVKHILVCIAEIVGDTVGDIIGVGVGALRFVYWSYLRGAGSHCISEKFRESTKTSRAYLSLSSMRRVSLWRMFWFRVYTHFEQKSEGHGGSKSAFFSLRCVDDILGPTHITGCGPSGFSRQAWFSSMRFRLEVSRCGGL